MLSLNGVNIRVLLVKVFSYSIVHITIDLSRIRLDDHGTMVSSRRRPWETKEPSSVSTWKHCFAIIQANTGKVFWFAHEQYSWFVGVFQFDSKSVCFFSRHSSIREHFWRCQIFSWFLWFCLELFSMGNATFLKCSYTPGEILDTSEEPYFKQVAEGN